MIGDLDEAVGRIAAAQHGVFARRQARELGATGEAIDWRVTCGRWEALPDGVLRMPGAPATARQAVMAATLAYEGAASHSTAAALLGIPGFSLRPVEVTVRRRPYRVAHVAIWHRSRVLSESHLVVVEGITTTSTVRTVFDLAGRLHPGRAERVLDTVLTRNPALVKEFHSMLPELACKGRTGIAVMRELLKRCGPGYIAPASELEARALAALEAAGLPEPIRQFRAGSEHEWLGQVDLAYPDHRLLIELDSRLHHSSLVDMEHDKERYSALAAAGWRVIQATWDLVTRRPERFTALVREALDLHPAFA